MGVNDCFWALNESQRLATTYVLAIYWLNNRHKNFRKRINYVLLIIFNIIKFINSNISKS
jgi:hypothetical protein